MADLLATDPDSIDPTVREVVAPGAAISAVDLWKGIYRLAALKRYADEMWDDVDVLVLPTAGTTYRVAELQAAPIALNSNLGRYTNFVNLLDMAAVVVPAGARSNGRGFGITLIGPADSDQGCLPWRMTIWRRPAFPARPHSIWRERCKA